MKKLIFSILISTLALSSSAFASFNGSWTGSAIVSNYAGYQTPCFIMLNLEQTESRLAIKKLRCMGKEFNFEVEEGYEFDNHQGKLLKKNLVIGVVQDHYLHIRKIDSLGHNRNDVATLNLIKGQDAQGQEINYLEVRFLSGEGLFKLEGTLEKKK